MNTKALFLLLGAMSLSFVLVLGIMISAVSSEKKRAPQRRVVITETVHQAQPSAKTPPAQRPDNKQAAAQKQPTSAAAVAEKSSAQKPTPQSELVPVLQTEKTPPAPVATSTLPTQVRPDPKTLREFSTLKKELQHEIGALKKDRDSMLEALAQSLVLLPANEIAAELKSLDDEMAAQTLRHIGKTKREAVLGDIDAARAQKLRQRLRQLGVK